MDWFSLAAYIVQNSGHPVYGGTGFRDGDAVAGIVGYEMDRTMPEYPLPAHTTRAVLSRSPFFDINGRADYAESTIYQAPSGAWVFAAGTISWSWGLDHFVAGRADPRIQKTTENVFALFLGEVP